MGPTLSPQLDDINLIRTRSACDRLAASVAYAEDRWAAVSALRLHADQSGTPSPRATGARAAELGRVNRAARHSPGQVYAALANPHRYKDWSR